MFRVRYFNSIDQLKLGNISAATAGKIPFNLVNEILTKVYWKFIIGTCGSEIPINFLGKGGRFCADLNYEV
jgi:hypothetical protein